MNMMNSANMEVPTAAELRKLRVVDLQKELQSLATVSCKMVQYLQHAPELPPTPAPGTGPWPPAALCMQ